MHYECISFLNLRFENDVKEYGIQANVVHLCLELKNIFISIYFIEIELLFMGKIIIRGEPIKNENVT